MHIFSGRTAERFQRKIESRGEAYKKAFTVWQNWFLSKYNSDLIENNDDPIEKIADDWKEELSRWKVDRGIFIALHSDEDELAEFVRRGDGIFSGIAATDINDPGAADIFKKRVTEDGFRGLKLYPTIEGFSPSDKRLYPVYETARFYDVPVMFHFGLTLQYDADMAYANPVTLHQVMKDFPEVKFIIPHFGAGYLQEVLFLAYHVQNLFIDTSGTNRWIEYLPYELTLEQVFKKSLAVVGPERILFGTDSRMLSKGYRYSVLKSQMKILDSLNLSREETALIMGENSKRLFFRS